MRHIAQLVGICRILHKENKKSKKSIKLFENQFKKNKNTISFIHILQNKTVVFQPYTRQNLLL